MRCLRTPRAGYYLDTDRVVLDGNTIEFYAECGRCHREVDFLVKLQGVHANITPYCLGVICPDCWGEFKEEMLSEKSDGEPMWYLDGDDIIHSPDGFFRKLSLVTRKENKLPMSEEHQDEILVPAEGAEKEMIEQVEWSERGKISEKDALVTSIPDETKEEIMTALAVKPERDEFGIMDSYDEMQIVSDIHQSISDDILKAWVYKTRGGGMEITYNAVRHWSNVRTQKGFPIAVEEAMQIDFSNIIDGIIKAQQAGIYTEEEAKEHLSFYFDNLLIQVRATDVVTKQSRLGFAEQPIRDGGKEDPFAFRKAAGKAQRNALKEFMTAEEKAAIIYMAETQGRRTVELKKPIDKFDSKRQLINEIENAVPQERIDKFLENLSEASGKQITSLTQVSMAKLKSIVASIRKDNV